MLESQSTKLSDEGIF